jgi:hypothetical protein
MTIQHKQSGPKGVFFIKEDDETVAELVYSVTHDDQMMLEHTEVDEELRGGSLGYELVHKAVEHARMYQFTVIPLCSFAKAVFEKKPEYKDVLG